MTFRLTLILNPRAATFQARTLKLETSSDRHVEREAAGASARARLCEAKVCELHDPAARLVAPHARDREPREVEKHARPLVLRCARDERGIFAGRLLDGDEVVRAVGGLAERDVEAVRRAARLREAAPRQRVCRE